VGPPLGVLITSVAVQLAACALALLLLRFDKRKAGWFALSAAFLLMAVRRLLALDLELTRQSAWLLGLSAQEAVSLLASLLVLAGVLLMRPFFRHADEDSLSATRLAGAIEESEAKYRFLVENIHDALVVLVADSIVFASSAFEGIFGKAPDDVTGRGLSNFIAAEDRQRVADFLLSRSAGAGDKTSVEAGILRFDGHRRWVRIVTNPAEWDGEVVTVALVTDITERKNAEEELRESEARYRAIVEDQTELVCRFRPDGILTFVNDAFARHLGQPSRALLGNSLLRVMPGIERTTFLRELRSLATARTPRVAVRRTVAPTGQVVWQQWTDRAILDESGAMAEVQAVGRDITQQVLAEQALRASEERYRRMFSARNAIKLLIDPDTGAIVDANPEACNFYGYSLQRMRKLRLSDIDSGMSRSEIARRLSIARSRETSSFQVRALLATGGIRNIEVHASPIELHGRTYLFSVIHDVTERVEAEATRDRSLRYLRAAAEAASRLLAHSDARDAADGVLATLGSAAAADRCYWAELHEDLDGRPCLSQRAEWCAPGVVAQIAEPAFQNMSADAFPDEFARLAANEILKGSAGDFSGAVQALLEPHGIASILLLPLHSGASLQGFLGFDSVSERRWRQEEVDLLRAGAQAFALALARQEQERQARELEERLRQAQKMEALGTLASGIAHDFGNVATVIGGAAALLEREGSETSPGRDEVAIIHRAADSAAELTRGLLAFARRQVIEPTIVSMAAVVEESLPMVRRLIPSNVEILTDLGDRGSVRADRGQLQQALLNLCVNARDAMPEGGTLAVSVRSAALDAEYVKNHPWACEGSFVCLSITDTGRGISADMLQHVFDPFFTTKEASRGTGLGLAIVYSIAKQHGGVVDAASSPGLGSTFRILLPAVEAPLAEATRAERQRRLSGTEHVLFVEDHADLREVVATYLAMHGYHVSEAGDGEEAFAFLREASPPVDAIISDIVMPRMGGLEFTEAVRAQWPAMAVVLATGFGDEPSLSRLAGRRRLVLVPKPYELDGLAEKLRQVLDEPDDPACGPR
jgi:two-component system cell cycle sensor histidine kinase/response regulator CckA